jgi:hypothetical protein
VWKKSLAAKIQVECDILSKLQVGEAMLQTTNNTLQLDGTKKRFEEYASFAVQTGELNRWLVETVLNT